MSEPTNGNGEDVRSAQPHSKTTSRNNFSGKSTSVEAQHHRIINALREGPKTTYELRSLAPMATQSAPLMASQSAPPRPT
jgi:hypothetical protein